MSLYVTIMYCLSLFGFFILFFSFSLLIFVPTKLNNFTRFVIHGHDLISAITQLYVTLGSTPTLLFPCSSGYMSGLLSPLGMRPLDQFWIQVTLIAISVSFSLLLTINRAFAINTWMKKHENLILIIFFVQLIAQVIYLYFAGVNLVDGGEEARQICLEKLPYKYPKVMYSSRGFDLSLQDIGMTMICSYTLLYTVIYFLIGAVCVSILIQSIREQAKSSQSTQFLANQRRITSGILYFMIVETVSFGCPFAVLCFSVFLNVGNSVVSQLAFMTISIYPIFGPYYILMSNTDYRNKVKGILRKGWFMVLVLFSLLHFSVVIQSEMVLLSAHELGTSHLSN